MARTGEQQFRDSDLSHRLSKFFPILSPILPRSRSAFRASLALVTVVRTALFFLNLKALIGLFSVV